MIAILDYGAGNLHSVANALKAPFEVVATAAALATATSIILPGVGHFGQMMRALDAMNVREVLTTRIRQGVPFLGICLGLQALVEGSEEAPEAHGLGIFPGQVRRFTGPLRIPHMGWNLVTPTSSRLLPAPAHFYFANSYYLPLHAATAAICEYGQPFTAILEHQNIFAVQFHPEKSGPAGLALLQRFTELAAC